LEAHANRPAELIKSCDGVLNAAQGVVCRNAATLRKEGIAIAGDVQFAVSPGATRLAKNKHAIPGVADLGGGSGNPPKVRVAVLHRHPVVEDSDVVSVGNATVAAFGVCTCQISLATDHPSAVLPVVADGAAAEDTRGSRVGSLCKARERPIRVAKTGAG